MLSEIYVVDASGSILRGSDSIFAVLAKHKRLSWLAAMGTLPIFKQCARPIYRLIAAQRHFIFGPLARIFRIRIITVFGLIAGLLFSLPLWTGERIIPLVPVFTVSEPTIISSILFIALLLLLPCALLCPKPKSALFLVPVILCLLALLDQNRIQPWVYHYGVTLLLLSTYSWKPNTILEQEKILNVMRLMVAAMYFYSGLQKVNPVFVNAVFPFMVEPFIGNSHYFFSVYAGSLVSCIEMFIGIGLLFRKTRSLAIAGAIAMLFFVLLTLGPLGNDWNTVVWPWNIVLTSLVLLLFLRLETNAQEIITHIPKTVVSTMVLVLFLVCPIFFFFNSWDAYPSFSLYSGQTATMQVSVPDKFELPPEFAPYTYTLIESRKNIDVMQLAVSDIHVPLYPETRVYRAVADTICSTLDNDKRVHIEFIPRLQWLRDSDEERVTCADL